MLHVRKVEESDRPSLIAAAQADPYHVKAGLTGDHWVDESSIIYDDEIGDVVALKCTKVVRVDIQFMTQDPHRNAMALKQGFDAFVKVFQKRGVKEIIFNTESPSVMKFFASRYKFRELEKGTFSLRII